MTLFLPLLASPRLASPSLLHITAPKCVESNHVLISAMQGRVGLIQDTHGKDGENEELC